MYQGLGKYQNDTINKNVWYTASGEFVYAILLNWPEDSTTIELGAPISSVSTKISVLGREGAIDWHSSSEKSGIIIDITNLKAYSLPTDWAWVFKLENVEGRNDNEQKIFRKLFEAKEMGEKLKKL